LAAHAVSQPAGWDDELKMPVPQDLNPDPHVLEVELEARVADVELLPGTKTPAWTYNGTVPGPMLRATVGDRVIVRALPEPLRLIEPTGSTPFYDLLRTKASLLPY